MLFIVDTSQSTNVTDPSPMACNAMQCWNRRAQAILDVLAQNPAGNGVTYGLIAFGSESSILTPFMSPLPAPLLPLPPLAAGSGSPSFF